MTIGDIIKSYRENNKISQDEFATMTGLSKAYISILERNRNPVNNKPVVPSLATTKAIARAVGIDFNELFAILDGEQPISLTTNPERVAAGIPIDAAISCNSDHLSAHEEEHIKKYRRLSQQGKQTVDSLVDNLLLMNGAEPQEKELPPAALENA